MKHQGQINFSYFYDEGELTFNCNDSKEKCRYARYSIEPPEKGMMCAYERENWSCSNPRLRKHLMEKAISIMTNDLTTLQENIGEA